MENNRCDKIDDPTHDRARENPQYTDDQQQNVAAASALHDAIYHPDDIQKGNAKDYFDDPRKIIHPTDKDILFQFDHLFFSLTIY